VKILYKIIEESNTPLAPAWGSLLAGLEADTTRFSGGGLEKLKSQID